MIHQYKMEGYHIVLDVNSGCIHTVDDVAYDIISLYPQKSIGHIKNIITKKYSVTEEEIDQVISDLEELKAQGTLYTEDSFAPQADRFKSRQSVLKALCLHIAHDCNMRCQYCFAGEGEYHGEKSLMSFEVGKQALDFLAANSDGRHNLEVDFFGGEPLLAFPTIKKLVSYGRAHEKEWGKKFRFTLTTNGILLDDEVMEFANAEMSNVVLSLDGRKSVNDRMRQLPGNMGSTYDAVLPAFQRFVKMRGQKDYYIRGTYTHYNLDFTKDILHMADLGFQELSMEPVVADKSAPYALQPEDVPELLSQYQQLTSQMLKRKRQNSGFNFYHYMIDLTGGPCIVKRISGCGVGTEYMAVTPSGELYPCHQFAGEEKFLLGNVFDGISNHSICNDFQQCNIYAHPECTDCFAKLYCSGGCAANAYHTSGSITGIYEMGCQLHRKRIECAIALKVAEMSEEW